MALIAFTMVPENIIRGLMKLQLFLILEAHASLTEASLSE